MKRHWLLPLLLGLFFGAAAGYVLAGRLHSRGAAKGTAFLREFSFSAVSAKAGHADWKVLEDRIYDSSNSPAPGHGIARRIIARATMREAEQSESATHVEEAIAAWLTSNGGTVIGHFGIDEGTVHTENEAVIHSLIRAPRRFYVMSGIHGMLDLSYVGENGQVTVIISIIEDP